MKPPLNGYHHNFHNLSDNVCINGNLGFLCTAEVPKSTLNSRMGKTIVNANALEAWDEATTRTCKFVSAIGKEKAAKNADYMKH